MATASTRRLVLAGYRNLLRATQQTFAGDAEALAASRVALRAAFVDNKNVTDKHELDTLIRGIDEAEEYVRMHIVQARLNERGNYEVELEEHHGEGGQGHIDVAVPLSGDAAVDGDVSQGGCQTATSGNPDSAYEIDLTGATADTK